MNRIFLILALITVTLFSCNNNKPDLYLTTTGAYASKEGGFIATFPSKPEITVQENVLGEVKFNSYLFRKIVVPNSLFTVAYLDYPLNVLENWEDKNNLFEQMVLSMAKSIDSFDIIKKEPFSGKDINGIYFEIGSIVQNGFGKGKVLLRGNRIYIAMFVGVGKLPSEEQINKFVNEFKLMKID
ncbi:MAG: hypothetical protein JXB49_16530 [Bacteroidales bacterium]|nr:hypothetical protein [Bacteroidales bacterium]